MTTAVIIQARVGSKRFPGKVLFLLDGWPIVCHVIHAALAIDEHVILAVPFGQTRLFHDDWPTIIEGPEDDVLKRYLLAAKAYHVETIIRITADCPLLRPDLCKAVLGIFNSGACDYAAIDWPRTFPKGYGCEVFSRKTLEMADREAFTPHDREHVTPWMQRNLKCLYLTQDKDESHVNLCVDYPEDILRLEKYLAEK